MIYRGADAQSPFETDYFPTFTTPDTVCVGAPVTIVNAIQGSTFYWNFCTGNASVPPQGVNIGNLNNNMSDPKFVTLVLDSIYCYSFVTSSGNSSITRNYHGLSFRNAPLSSSKIIGGVFSPEMKGIQILKDQGNWYGFVANGTFLLKMSFGNSLMNNPSIIDIPTPNINQPAGLVIAKELGTWIGFTMDSQNNQLSRLNFGASLNSNPAVTNLGNIGTLNAPVGIALKRINGFWYMLVCNQGDNSLSRLEFMNSLLNMPTGSNLGNVGGLDHNTGITLINDCQAVNGYVVNNTTTGSQLVHLEFPDGISGTIIGTPLPGNLDLNNPYGISEMIRKGDSIYMYATNEGNAALSKLFFPVCGSSSIPSYSGGSVPPPFSYSAPGSYNVILYVNEGAANASTSCNKIVVIQPSNVDLGPDLSICNGASATIGVDSGYYSYTWSTGNNTNSITVDTAGTYWVTVANSIGCQASDTINVSLNQGYSSTINRQICFGEQYFAQGAWQNTSGTYTDSLTNVYGCDSIIYTDLYVNPKIDVYLGKDTIFCPGNQFTLNATTPLASAYQWQDGSVDSIFNVYASGVFWVKVTVNNCFGTDTINFSDCPPRLYFPGAFSPNGDGLNDIYKPLGISITKFSLSIYDRWGQLKFETNDINDGWDGTFNGQVCPAGVYAYKAVYEMIEPENEIKTISGSFTLVK